MSQNYETCYSTLLNMRAYGQQFYNFLDYFIHFSLSSQHISLRLQHSFLSLLAGLHLSVAPYFFLTFIFFISPSLRLCVSFSLSFFFFFFPVTIFLSFFSCHEEGDSDLKQSSSIEAHQSEVLLADLCSARPRAVADLCSSSSTVADLCSSSSTVAILCSSSSTALAADGWLSLVID